MIRIDVMSGHYRMLNQSGWAWQRIITDDGREILARCVTISLRKTTTDDKRSAASATSISSYRTDDYIYLDKYATYIMLPGRPRASPFIRTSAQYRHVFARWPNCWYFRKVRAYFVERLIISHGLKLEQLNKKY